MKTHRLLFHSILTLFFFAIHSNMIAQILVADAGNDASLCQPNNVTIGGIPTASGGTPPYTYLWSPSTSLSSPTTANPTAAPTNTTTYFVTVTDMNGVSATDAVTIYIASPITMTATPINPTICIGDSVLITASGATTYAWIPSTGLSSSTGASIYAFPSTTTTYTVTGTDISGCTGSTTVTVTVNSCVGILENSNQDDFQITSFPDIDKITITINNNSILTDAIIAIYDIKGQLMLQRLLSQNMTDIDISQLIKGNYILKINYSNKIFTKKIIKK